MSVPAGTLLVGIGSPHAVAVFFQQCGQNGTYAGFVINNQYSGFFHTTRLPNAVLIYLEGNLHFRTTTVGLFYPYVAITSFDYTITNG